MKLECLYILQEPVIGACSEPDEFSQHHPTHLCKININIIHLHTQM